MSKTCPSCGAAIATEARFCRRCGTPVRSGGDDEPVSPLAATIPLTDETRTTDGLAPGEAGRPGPETSRVDRAELDSLLRHAAETHAAPFGQPTPTPRADQTEFLPVREARAARDEELGHKTVFDSRLQGPPARPAGDASAAGHSAGVAPPPMFDGGGGEELTITVARGEDTNFFPPARQVELTEGFTPVPPPTDQLRQSGPVAPAAVQQPAPPAKKPRARYVWFAAAGASLFLLLVTVLAVWLGVGYFRKRETPTPSADAAAPAADPRQLSEEKAAEAEALLAGGDLDAAIARLREATTVDPSNAKALKRLGDLLLDNGRRREAIEAFRALTERDARDAEAWRSLARAQLDESLFADAAESYRRLVALGGTSALNDNELLSYAEALRLSGKPDEARAFYERLANSTFADVAASARQRLAESASTQPSPSSSPDPQRDARAQAGQTSSQPFLAPSPQQPTPSQATPTPPAPARTEPTPAPALSAAEHFARGEQLWSSSRQQAVGEFRSAAAKGNTDAYYYLGLAIVQGRDPGSLQRAELVMALQYFQNARRGGRFRAESQRYEDQLGREFDRRRQR